MKVLFDDELFDGQLLRALDTTPHGGADVGECLTTAQRIPSGDDERWYAEWSATADRINAEAEASEAAGHTISARDGYLRASSYYRTAFIVMYRSPVDPRALENLRKHRAAYRRAAELFSPPIEPISIPYSGTTLPGYFHRIDAGGAARPLLILTSGYDGTAEEAHFSVRGALERGYNALCFDGPGQGLVLFEQRLFMRPDWEQVVSPVVDYALTRAEVDPKRIVLMGRSWGGYLAPRAASGEPRLAACIADPGLYSPVTMIAGWLGAFGVGDASSGSEEALGRVLGKMLANRSLAFSIRRGMLVHDQPTPLAYLRGMTDYTIEGRVGQIACPTLVCQAEADARASQSKELYDALTCPKRLIEFSSAEGAGEHCESGAATLWSQRVFDWLDETLR